MTSFPDVAEHTAKPTALIVHAHPEPNSFSNAQMRSARSSLQDQGYYVKTIYLYEKNWSPVLDRSEFPSAATYFKPQAEQLAAANAETLAAEVRADLEALLDADLLVLSFPLWWFSLPAILKGWIDRVFVMGAVFGGEHGLFNQAALAGHKAVLLITTGGSPDSFGEGHRFGVLNTHLFHIHLGMLRFVGYDVLEPIVTYGPAHLDADNRDAALSAVHDAFEQISTRPALSLGTPTRP
ncbi:flavodoxin family protein [Cryobacterium suzukii]|uniref:Flavodoxin family protein n=1 Tax=Cryobacterium suzukii TaxID=1259198 RepID=A0A4R9AK15_9MICO|nr:NAD(P)H-dependent oxidoreductase [Cryobacterium suzukii]TFD63211.1 flavodoxin family protein [Cryobacterium suzukii]